MTVIQPSSVGLGSKNTTLKTVGGGWSAQEGGAELVWVVKLLP